MKREAKAAILAAACIALSIASTVMIAAMIRDEVGPQPAHAEGFVAEVNDAAATVVDSGRARLNVHDAASEHDANATESQQERDTGIVYDEVVYMPAYEAIEAYTASYSFETRGNPDGLNSFDGVFDFGGRHETFYSGDGAAYRDSLWVDESGFYRTDSGHYAVAASDMPMGATFEGSQGTCEVVDSGCVDGVTDYCVSGW